MQILTCNSPGKLEYSEAKKPELVFGKSLLKIQYIGICGTDYHAFEGTQPFFTYPRILGHEISAKVEECGVESGLKIGELVTISPYYYCGDCIACRMGKTNCCAEMKVCGVHIDGAMQEYFLVPNSAIIRGNDLSAEELVLVEPLAIGAHGVAKADITEGEFVLVMGAGPIGLGTMNFALIAGAKVIALDVNAQRLDFCTQKLGVQYTINVLQEDVLAKLKEITGGDMPTVVIDCTGNLKAINNGVQYMAHGARFVLIGLQRDDLTINHPEFHKREGTLMSSRNAVLKDFEFVIDCIKKGLVKPNNFITHRISFQEIKNEFESLVKPENEVIKAIIQF